MINIIGFNGGMFSGKDTAAQLFIQNEINSDKNWKITKFAGKLKEICSIMLGIAVADLEKEEVKNKVLGPEWNRHFVVDKRTKKIIRELFKKDEIVDFLRDPEDINYEYFEKTITVREFMQLMGTEAVRYNIHPKAWINALFADYKPYEVININLDDYDSESEATENVSSKERLPYWLITDTRFLDEAEAILDRGGVIVKILRPFGLRFPKYKHLEDPNNKYTTPVELQEIDPDLYKKLTHISETNLNGFTGFVYTIYNDAGIEELDQKVKQFYDIISLK